MLIRKSLKFGSLVRRSGRGLILLALYVTVFVVADRLGAPDIEVPLAIPAMMATALSILLGFRTGAAYDRWWEARKIWGAIVNDSRTFARQVLTLFVAPEGSEERTAMRALQKEMIYRQIAWPYALGRSLRRQDARADLVPFLSPDELTALATEQNGPNALLQTQAERIHIARKNRYLDPVLSLPLEDTVKRFSDHMGMCERIKHTPFPSTYAYCVSRSVTLLFILLPLSLVEYLGWVAIPVSVILAAIFLLIEMISEFLQNPFENEVSDTPMAALSRTIEINLRQQMGEVELPPATEPVDGVLM